MSSRRLLSVVFLHAAEQDLLELKDYVLKNFGAVVWRTTYRKIRDATTRLKKFPHEGRVPDELARLDIGQYRQVIAGMNRIIYEIRGDTLFIHIVCDTRKEMRVLLTRRMLRPE